MKYGCHPTDLVTRSNRQWQVDFSSVFRRDSCKWSKEKPNFRGECVVCVNFHFKACLVFFQIGRIGKSGNAWVGSVGYTYAVCWAGV